MRYFLRCCIMISLVFFCALSVQADEARKAQGGEYAVGVEDVLDINILQPDKLATQATVAPDGMIAFPYLGNIYVKGMTLTQIQDDVQLRLANGYMKYPVVTVSLKDSRSKKFFVYGEVAKPGMYTLEDRVTVVKAISLAGGYSKYGSARNVKILRPVEGGSGYKTIKINVQAVTSGSLRQDVSVQPDDIIVVSQGIL